jgi:hypothetical protein
MIYEKRPDTVEAVQYNIVDGVRDFSSTPKWLLDLLTGGFDYTPRDCIRVEDDCIWYFSADGSVIEKVEPTGWLVRDENGRIDIYDEETFIRKFKKVT